MRPRDYVEEVLRYGVVERPPVAPLIGFHSAYIYGVDPKRAASDGEVMADLQMRIAEHYGVDAIFMYMDLTLEPEAYGCKIKWDFIPSVIEPLYLSSLDDLSNLDEDIHNKGRVPEFLKAVKVLHDKASDRYLICAYVTGPLTLASNVLGIEFMLKNLVRNPEFALGAIDKFKKVTLNLVKAFYDVGADCIMVLEPNGALISPRMFKNYLLKPIEEIIQEIKSKGMWAILHICGNAVKVLDLMVKSNAHALSIDKYINVGESLKKYPKTIFMGNIGTGELYTSTPEVIRDMVLKLLNETDGERLIVSTGCEVPPYTPEENLRVMVKVTKSFKLRK